MLNTPFIVLDVGTEHYCNTTNQYKISMKLPKYYIGLGGMIVAILSIGLLFVSGLHECLKC